MYLVPVMNIIKFYSMYIYIYVLVYMAYTQHMYIRPKVINVNEICGYERV